MLLSSEHYKEKCSEAQAGVLGCLHACKSYLRILQTTSSLCRLDLNLKI